MSLHILLLLQKDANNMTIIYGKDTGCNIHMLQAEFGVAGVLVCHLS